MQLGYIQQIVLSHIKQYADCRFRLYSQATLKARAFSSFDFAQVERAVTALEKRKILRRDGPFYQLEQSSAQPGYVESSDVDAVWEPPSFLLN